MERLKAYAIPLSFCLGGLLLAHHEVLLSGFALTQYDPGDTRFCNYLLEHGYRWLTGHPAHPELWSPPYFYPAAGTLAYAENMLGSMPLYGLWRALGFRIDTALQLWVLSLGVANFLSAYLLFRRCFSLGQLPSAAGAALFAYAGARINQTMHYQLFPHFFSVLAVYAACRLLGGDLEKLSRAQRHVWIGVFFASVAGQLYAGIYLGWYLGFTLAVAALLALPFAATRRPLFKLVARHPLALLVGAGLMLAAVAPMMLRYAEVGRQFGTRPFYEVLSMVPQWRSWFNFGPSSWAYGWAFERGWFAGIPMEHEQRCGFGVLTTALCLGGYWFARKKPGVLLIGAVLLLVVASATLYGGFTPWKWVYQLFPGAQAIRGVSRIALWLLLPVSLGAAFLLQRLTARGGPGAAAAAALGLLAVLEQGETTPAFDKHQAREDLLAITSKLQPGCQAFLFSPVQGYAPIWKYQLDAMMASLESGVPTLNGYSGHEPPGWPFGDISLFSQGHFDSLSQRLTHWSNLSGLDPSKLCWVRVGLQEGPYRAVQLHQSVPKAMIAGNSYEASLTVRNTGTEPWVPGEGFRLGSLNPPDNVTWGQNRIDLPGPLPPGEELTVRFTVKAPSAPGRYSFQWGTLKEGVRWFGATLEPAQVEVMAGEVSQRASPHLLE